MSQQQQSNNNKKRRNPNAAMPGNNKMITFNEFNLILD